MKMILLILLTILNFNAFANTNCIICANPMGGTFASASLCLEKCNACTTDCQQWDNPTSTPTVPCIICANPMGGTFGSASLCLEKCNACTADCQQWDNPPPTHTVPCKICANPMGLTFASASLCLEKCNACTEDCQQWGDDPSPSGYKMLWMNEKTTDIYIWYLNDKYKIDDTKGDSINPGFMKYEPNSKGWEVRSYHTNSSGLTKMTWMKTSGTSATVWNINSKEKLISKDSVVIPTTSSRSSTPGFFLYDSNNPGWSVVDNHFYDDGTSEMLWMNDSSKILTIWYIKKNGNIDTSKADKGFRTPEIDPKHVVGYTPVDYHVTSDGARILWRHDTSAKATLWLYDNSWKKTAMSFKNFEGPSEFRAASYHINKNDTAELIWEKQSSGDVEIWHLDASNNKIGNANKFNHSNLDKSWIVVGLSGDYTSNKKVKIVSSKNVSVPINSKTGKKMNREINNANKKRPKHISP